jgi:hypothetical protein
MSAIGTLALTGGANLAEQKDSKKCDLKRVPARCLPLEAACVDRAIERNWMVFDSAERHCGVMAASPRIFDVGR